MKLVIAPVKRNDINDSLGLQRPHIRNSGKVQELIHCCYNAIHLYAFTDAWVPLKKRLISFICDVHNKQPYAAIVLKAFAKSLLYLLLQLIRSEESRGKVKRHVFTTKLNSWACNYDPEEHCKPQVAGWPSMARAQ
uniref:Uncharacterized protein n=1 Tax=Glossina austeni TaxID=7395 RepID=A0A1A9VAK4_GLOAU